MVLLNRRRSRSQSFDWRRLQVGLPSQVERTLLVFSMLPTSNPTDGAGHEAHPSLALGGRRVWIVLTLSVLVLVALLLRLQTAWQRNHASPDALALRLVGDEIDYEG